MPDVFTFPNRILFGDDARTCLGAELASLGVRRPLVVTDFGLMRSGILARILEAIPAAVVHDAVSSNPTEAEVLAGLATYRERDRDGLIALGGGSPIDAAKAIRLLVAHPGPLVNYDVTTGGTARIGQKERGALPLIALPTTAGAGSEVSQATFIQLPRPGHGVTIESPFLLPDVAICDPLLTLSLPAELTAGTGLAAFSHCIESYLSTIYHPICDGIALEGLRHIARGLEPAVRDGADRPARRSLMMGALLGGISMHKGLGVVHSLSRALGFEGRVHQGALNAILLPHALRFNRPAAEPRMAALARQLGVGRGSQGPDHLIALIELLLARMPLPRRLGAVEGLESSHIPQYARLALADQFQRTNPRPCSQAELEDLLQRAW